MTDQETLNRSVVSRKQRANRPPSSVPSSLVRDSNRRASSATKYDDLQSLASRRTPSERSHNKINAISTTLNPSKCQSAPVNSNKSESGHSQRPLQLWDALVAHEHAFVNRLTATMMAAVQKTRQKYKRYEKPRQEISVCLKYTVFLANFIFLLFSLTCLSIGLYLFIDYYRPISHALDFVLNPGLLLTWLGILLVFVTSLGTIGALRDNVCMLKSFALMVFGCYISLVVCAFLLFILFYSQSTDGVSVHSLLLTALTHYHSNENMRDFFDYVQRELRCCGVSSAGYKDWSMNAQYNCTTNNQQPESCAVPFSCCRHPLVDTPGQTVEAANKLLSQMRSLQCWQNAQRKSLPELQSLINVDGCLQFVQKTFESQAVTIGAIVGAFVIPVCISVTLANILAKQIERQHYLLDREKRRDQRRRRRERHRFRDPFAQAYAPGARQPLNAATVVDETTGAVSNAAGGSKSKSKSPPTDADATGRGPDAAAGDKRRVRRRKRTRSAPSYAQGETNKTMGGATAADGSVDNSDIEIEMFNNSDATSNEKRPPTSSSTSNNAKSSSKAVKSSVSQNPAGADAVVRRRKEQERRAKANRTKSVGDAVRQSALIASTTSANTDELGAVSADRTLNVKPKPRS